MSGAEKPPSKKRSAETVLVVEDSLHNRKIIAHLIKRSGFQVVEAKDGQEALVKLANPSLKISAIFSDIMMPIIGGLSFCKEVRKNPDHKQTPIVFVTAVADRESIVEAGSLGAINYVLKPISSEKVTSALRAVFPDRDIADLKSPDS